MSLHPSSHRGSPQDFHGGLEGFSGGPLSPLFYTNSTKIPMRVNIRSRMPVDSYRENSSTPRVL
jgi:hypothetical protein